MNVLVGVAAIVAMFLILVVPHELGHFTAAKVFGVETQIDVCRAFLGILGAAGYLRPGTPGAALRGEVERAARAAQVNTFGGGVLEVLREIVASAGLQMVRQAR